MSRRQSWVVTNPDSHYHVLQYLYFNGLVEQAEADFVVNDKRDQLKRLVTHQVDGRTGDDLLFSWVVGWRRLVVVEYELGESN